MCLKYLYFHTYNLQLETDGKETEKYQQLLSAGSYICTLTGRLKIRSSYFGTHNVPILKMEENSTQYKLFTTFDFLSQTSKINLTIIKTKGYSSHEGYLIYLSLQHIYTENVVMICRSWLCLHYFTSSDRGYFEVFVGASQVVLVVKNLPANSGDIRHVGLIPGSGRTSGRGHGKPLQYSCLENPMDRVAQWGYGPSGQRVGHHLACMHEAFIERVNLTVFSIDLPFIYFCVSQCSFTYVDQLYNLYPRLY